LFITIEFSILIGVPSTHSQWPCFDTRSLQSNYLIWFLFHYIF